MAKRLPAPDPDQMQLIEVDTPEGKVLKKLLSAYQGKVDRHKQAGEERDEARQALVEKVREFGKADSQGNIRVTISGIDISIEPEEKVKIKAHADKEHDNLDDDGEAAEAGDGPALKFRSK